MPYKGLSHFPPGCSLYESLTDAKDRKSINGVSGREIKPWWRNQPVFAKRHTPTYSCRQKIFVKRTRGKMVAEAASMSSDSRDIISRCTRNCVFTGSGVLYTIPYSYIAPLNANTVTAWPDISTQLSIKLIFISPVLFDICFE